MRPFNVVKRLRTNPTTYNNYMSCMYHQSSSHHGHSRRLLSSSSLISHHSGFIARRPEDRIKPITTRTGSFIHGIPTTRCRFASLRPDAAASAEPSPTDDALTTTITTSKEEGQNHSAYEHWVRRLYMTNMFNPVKLGLENIEKIHSLLGNPMDDPNVAVIHIAGTNGKGSVAWKIAKTLELMDLNVGLFCSPHVSSFRERMQLNGRLISEEQVVEYLPRIYALCEEHGIPATFFELTAALAFLFYRKNHAHVVVLETGLGGRLDSTNVVKSPACAVITSIGLEHTRILGDTIEKIALEKGGIIKPNRPVLVGPHVPHAVLRQCAAEKRASAYHTCDDILLDNNNNNNIPEKENDAGSLSRTQPQQSSSSSSADIPDYDEENARIATAALRLVVEREKRIPKLVSTTANFSIPDDIIRQGTSQRPPCRFEVVERRRDDNGWIPRVILDVAHNPPAMQYLVHKLKTTFPNSKFRMIVGMSSDKDSNLCGRYILDAVNGDATAVHLVQASHPRAAPLETILDCDSSGLLKKDSHYDFADRSVTKQIGLALEMAQKQQQRHGDEIVVVCGSVFLMAEAREALGFDEPRDSEYIAEVAGAHLRHGQENFGNRENR